MEAIGFVCHNWRQQQPYVSHYSAIIWPLFRPHDSSEAKPPELARLRRMIGFVKHALQGRKRSDFHHHEDLEQVYYILKGRAEVLLGDHRHPVQEGDVVYLPPKLPHQMFNQGGDDWAELLILSCKVNRFGGLPMVQNWRNEIPVVGDDPVITWTMLESVDRKGTSGDRQRLLGMDEILVSALQQGKQSSVRRYETQEHIYYVTEGEGSIRVGNVCYPVREGDAIYAPEKLEHSLANDGAFDWLRFVSMAATL